MLHRKKILIALTVAIVILLISSIIYLEFSNSSTNSSVKISMGLQQERKDVTPNYSTGYFYQNGTKDYNFTVNTDTTCLLYNIHVYNNGKTPLNNVTLLIDDVSEPLALGSLDTTNNNTFLPSNPNHLPRMIYYENALNPNQSSMGGALEIALRTPTVKGNYSISFRFESAEVSFPFNVTIAVI
jgi:hypothetical protein